MSLIRIQQYERGSWRMLALDEIQHTSLGVFIGGHFRILVKTKVVYDNKEKTK